MTLREKFKPKVSINTDGEAGRYANECEQIADDYAIEFSEWVSYKYKYLDNKGWFATTYQLEMGIFLSSKELLEIFKKEKDL